MSRFLSALRFWYPFGVLLRRALDWLRVDAEVERFLRRGPEYIADTPDFDEHADMAQRMVLAGRDLDYARVPAAPLPSVPMGTGESLARELTDFLKEIAR